VLPAVGLEGQLGDAVADLDELRALAAADAIVDRIRVTPTGRVQSGWFADGSTFDGFRSFWTRNCGFTLRRLTRDGEPEAPGDGPTDRKREALRTAYGTGYFEVPRSASLEDVADESASPRPRSPSGSVAQTHLVETTVASTWPPLPE
jgi:hypothetical protein